MYSTKPGTAGLSKIEPTLPRGYQQMGWGIHSTTYDDIRGIRIETCDLWKPNHFTEDDEKRPFVYESWQLSGDRQGFRVVFPAMTYDSMEALEPLLLKRVAVTCPVCDFHALEVNAAAQGGTSQVLLAPPFYKQVSTLAGYSDNPYLVEHRALLDPGWAQLSDKASKDVSFDDLMHCYSFAVPCEAFLKALSELGPIVELGAGTGYWAKLISDRGGDVIAYDLKPRSIRWYDVQQGSEQKVKTHSDRALLLCYPDELGPMSDKCLDAYMQCGGKTLVHIGSHGDSGSDRFFQLLRRNWREGAEIKSRVPGSFQELVRMRIYHAL